MDTLKRRDWLVRVLGALGLVGLTRAGVRAQAKPSFAEEFGADWQTAKAYTLEVANAMPAEKYDFTPGAAMRGFADLMVHIGQAQYGIVSAVRGGEPPAQMQPPAEKTKEAVVAYLTASFDYVAESVAQVNEARTQEVIKLFGGRLEMPVWKVFHFVRDHTTHHRAYGLPYLRLSGVEPPRYRFAGTRPSPV